MGVGGWWLVGMRLGSEAWGLGYGVWEYGVWGMGVRGGHGVRSGVLGLVHVFVCEVLVFGEEDAARGRHRVDFLELPAGENTWFGRIRGFGFRVWCCENGITRVQG